MDDQKRLQQLRTVQTLDTIAFIAGPVSLLIGGVLLATVALVCAIVAYVKARSLVRPEDAPGSLPASLRMQSIVAIVITAFALIVNAVWFAMTFTALMEVIQSGDYSSLMDALDGLDPNAQGPGDGTSGDSGSVWDR